MPPSVSESAASEYSRLLMSSQGNQAGPSSGESGGARLVESRSLTMDMMRVMAAEVARGEQSKKNNVDHYICNFSPFWPFLSTTRFF